MAKDIVLVSDYHDKQTEFRRFNEKTGREETFGLPTEAGAFSRLLSEACREARGQGGQVVWVMESTTGWARVKELVCPAARLELANVLQIPLPPKARRKKTDKLDTARLLREYRAGTLPLSFQPRPSLRRLRRLVALRQSLVRRRTAVRNWVNRYLAHESWRERKGLWSRKGAAALRAWCGGLAGQDRFVLGLRLGELEALELRVRAVEARLTRIARRWAPARRLDAIRGLGPVSAVGIAACIGPAGRFADAERLIAYAGLAPSVRQSAGHRLGGHLGGGGTDKLLRLLLIEASVWARQVPRYAEAYQRALQRRGAKVARLVVARMLLRSILALLRDRVEFSPAGAA